MEEVTQSRRANGDASTRGRAHSSDKTGLGRATCCVRQRAPGKPVVVTGNVDRLYVRLGEERSASSSDGSHGFATADPGRHEDIAFNPREFDSMMKPDATAVHARIA